MTPQTQTSTSDTLPPDLKAARTRSVDNLQRLYTVVISLAITEALRRIAAPPTPTYNSWLILLSLIATVVPFYHGANRYLDSTYVTGERAALHFALMIDFLFLFFEGLLFFVLAMNSGSREAFYTWLAGLFVFDIVWVSFAHMAALREGEADPGFYRWAMMNVIATIALLLFLWSNLLKWEFWPTDLTKNIALCAVVFLRTVYDYKNVWSFYYPRAQDRPYDRLVAPRPAPAPHAPSPDDARDK